MGQVLVTGVGLSVAAVLIAGWAGVPLACLLLYTAYLVYLFVVGGVRLSCAALSWVIVAACVWFFYAGDGGALTWLAGAAGLGYLAWVFLLPRAGEWRRGLPPPR